MTALLSLCVIVLGLGVGGVTVRDGRFRPFIWATSLLVLLFAVAVWNMTAVLEDFSPVGTAIFCAAAAWPSLGCVVGEVVQWYLCQGSREVGALKHDEI